MIIKPRANIHCHLDGSLRESTIFELGKKFNIKIPENFKFYDKMSLEVALSYFLTSLKLLQEKEELKRVASEICEDAIQDNVTKLEIRFAPHLHQQKGLKTEEVIDSVLEGIDGRAGLILCGLYGDNPKILENYVELVKTRRNVVAIDIAGAPHPNHNFTLRDYAPAYKKALEYGIGRTVHAGEGRDPIEIITAITELHAQRLGHATTLLESERATQLVLDKKIVIESCPTSNIQCAAINSFENHPLPQWLELGIKASINPDNTFFSNVSSSKEHIRALNINGMDEKLLELAIENGLTGTFSY